MRVSSRIDAHRGALQLKNRTRCDASYMRQCELSHRPKLLSPHWKYCPVDEKWDIWNKKCVSRLKPRYLVPFNITYWNRRRSYPTASDNPSSKLRISRLKL
ncbi:uncharacterized protein LOC113237589 isoform X1 [Hyposmocoma kahamanoa]|uniref:uncharacterized protein LOC113237589 isoform X1 n=1 Tax=Hyposmocoma kahamanoa TaxID=1477025 RepID=UPI000E6D7007|nr:uncharacterized protein LOC113237589 isoform X1 [Hyposmocoma kahamanoa]XP_026329942.1 uncharacterized protein LOC113237589 isoform X1 [Hyposmocoma kahamanoa]